jgi:aminopeptidase N
MAHPVRPDSFVEINNFYTVTVYNKGAEVVRMLHTLLGAQGFQRGMALYFARHDGQAVTCDDFVAALEDANRDRLTTGLEQFKRWYSQAGTPLVEVSEEWNEEQKKYTLTLAQSCPATPGQPDKQPFHIPLTIGLLNGQGQDMIAPDTLLELREARQSFSFAGLDERPTPSLLRNFSAPVKLAPFHSRDQLAFLMAHDSDLFNRWEAANQLSESILLEGVKALRQGDDLLIDPAFIEAFRHNLHQSTLDKALLAQMLTLPSESALALQMEIIDPEALHRARNRVRAALARQLEREFIQIYMENQDNSPYSLTPEAIGRRNLKNACLSLLLAADPLPTSFVQMAFNQYERQTNMTDTMAALSALAHCPAPERQMALADFYSRWQHDPLIVDKWLSLQAVSSLENTLETVQTLMRHPAFSLHNPNKVRALIGAFASGNPLRFHALSGAGYRFLADQILTLDPVNPQVAARLSSAFTTWRRYDINRQQLMREQMERISAQSGLSAGVYEIMQKSLMV